jgi:hypothetical protein
MLQTKLQVITSLGDMAGLPPGTRIATNHNKLLVLDVFLHSSRELAWFEEGELTPYTPIVDWLPVIVLPPTVDFLERIAREAARPTVCELRVEDL